MSKLWEHFHLSCQCPLFSASLWDAIHIRIRVTAHSSPPPFFSFLSSPELLSWPDSTTNSWPTSLEKGVREAGRRGSIFSQCACLCLPDICKQVQELIFFFFFTNEQRLVFMLILLSSFTPPSFSTPHLK